MSAIVATIGIDHVVPAAGMFLDNGDPLIIQRQLARAYGLNESIALHQIHHWIGVYRKANDREKHLRDGRWWIFNTYAKWQSDNFDFWSWHTIQRTLTYLESLGILISTSRYNARKGDQTKWYTIDYPMHEAFMRLWFDRDCPVSSAGRASEDYKAFLDDWNAQRNDQTNIASWNIAHAHQYSNLERAGSQLATPITRDKQQRSSAKTTKSVSAHAPATASISDAQLATPEQSEPESIVTEKESDLSADSTTPQTPSSAAPLSPPPTEQDEPRKLCRTCKQVKPVADFVDPGTGRQYAAKCNVCRAEDVAIKRAVDAKIAADDAANPPPLEVVRKHPLWVAYRDAIIDASAKLHGMTDALDLDPSGDKQTLRYVAILDKLQAQGVTPGAMAAFVHQRMAEHSRRKDKPPVYPFLWLDTDAPQLKFVKVVAPRSSAPALDWSTADGCIAIAENAQNAPETRVKALNKLRTYMTPWDVEIAQIERISAMLARVSHGDLEQEMAA